METPKKFQRAAGTWLTVEQHLLGMIVGQLAGTWSTNGGISSVPEHASRIVDSAQALVDEILRRTED